VAAVTADWTVGLLRWWETHQHKAHLRIWGSCAPKPPSICQCPCSALPRAAPWRLAAHCPEYARPVLSIEFFLKDREARGAWQINELALPEPIIPVTHYRLARAPQPASRAARAIVCGSFLARHKDRRLPDSPVNCAWALIERALIALPGGTPGALSLLSPTGQPRSGMDKPVTISRTRRLGHMPWPRKETGLQGRRPREPPKAP